MMGRKLRIRPGITSYEGAVSAYALRHAVQALHAGMPIDHLSARLAVAYPDLPILTITEIINQAKLAILGADQLQRQLFITEKPTIDSWGFDPTQQDEWRIQAVMYVEAPSSWWTRLIEIVGGNPPTPQQITQSIIDNANIGQPPGMGNPYPEDTSGIGLRDDIPEHALINEEQLARLNNLAEANAAPSWFQLAWNAAQSAGITLRQYGSRFAAAITGVFRNIRGE